MNTSPPLRSFYTVPTARQPASSASGSTTQLGAAAPARERQVCLVGAGNIAAVHAEVIRSLPGIQIAAIVDPNLDAARRLAEKWQVPNVHKSVIEAIGGDRFDAAHVLVPPDIHQAAALPLLDAGCAVLLEKPLATSATECRDLMAAAQRSGAILGVNQNFVHHPAFVRLRRDIADGRFGRPRFVDCIYSVPLRQLAARQFSHWMFQAPGNILLEQAVHPLSQLVALAGPVQEIRGIAGPAIEIAPGVPLFPSVTATFACASLPAQLRFAVGQPFPFWQVTVLCDDGVLVADILANRYHIHGRTRWLEVVDGLLSGTRTASGILGDALRNAGDYSLSTLRLKRRNDPFFRSMQGSIQAFHAALDTGTSPETDGAFGAALVSVCDSIGDAVFGSPARPLTKPALRRSGTKSTMADVAVLGGTGFIGTQTVGRLLADGKRVSVMARSTRNLPAMFGQDEVILHQGDIRDTAAVRRAVDVVPVVINLAHGGGGSSFEQIRTAMVGGAETVASACLTAGARRLIHVGSIASLYLGRSGDVVTGATPPDSHPEKRADYARAKALADLLLLDWHREKHLPVCVLRPGVVVGEGSSPFHSGLGTFNNEQHCIGWNRGDNPLPFVLVQDVAEAILLATQAENRVDGRCYNLVGDVRPTARDYILALGRAMGRSLQFHPSHPSVLWSEEVGKWAVKRVGGRKPNLPSLYDLFSRGMTASFDCSDAKRDLGWSPVSDPDVFSRLAIEVHGA